MYKKTKILIILGILLFLTNVDAYNNCICDKSNVGSNPSIVFNQNFQNYNPPITTMPWCSINPPLLGRDLHFYLFLAGVFVMVVLLLSFSRIDWMWGIFVIGFYMLFNNLFNFFCFQYPFPLIVLMFLLGAAVWYFKGRKIS